MFDGLSGRGMRREMTPGRSMIHATQLGLSYFCYSWTHCSNLCIFSTRRRDRRYLLGDECYCGDRASAGLRAQEGRRWVRARSKMVQPTCLTLRIGSVKPHVSDPGHHRGYNESTVHTCSIGHCYRVIFRQRWMMPKAHGAPYVTIILCILSPLGLRRSPMGGAVGRMSFFGRGPGIFLNRALVETSISQVSFDPLALVPLSVGKTS